MVFVLREDVRHFIPCVEDCCVDASHWGAHRCANFLDPVCIAKLEDVMFHHDFEEVNEKHNFVEGVWLREFFPVGLEEFRSDGDAFTRVNVWIHCNSVGGEEASGWRYLVELFNSMDNIVQIF